MKFIRPKLAVGLKSRAVYFFTPPPVLFKCAKAAETNAKSKCALRMAWRGFRGPGEAEVSDKELKTPRLRTQGW